MLSLGLRLVWAAAAVAGYVLEPELLGPSSYCPEAGAEFNQLTELLPTNRLPLPELTLMTTATGDQTWCQHMCQARPACRSVAFSGSASECRLYRAPAALEKTQLVTDSGGGGGDWLLANRMAQGAIGDRCCSPADCGLVAGRHQCDSLAGGRCACLDGLRAELSACLLDPARGQFTGRVAGAQPSLRYSLPSAAVSSVQQCRQLCLSTPWCLALLFSNQTGTCYLFRGVTTSDSSLSVPGLEAFLFDGESRPDDGFVADGHGRHFAYLPGPMTAYEASAACAGRSAILFPATGAADVELVLTLLNLTSGAKSQLDWESELRYSYTQLDGSLVSEQHTTVRTEPAPAACERCVLLGLDRLFYLQQLHVSSPDVAVTLMPLPPGGPTANSTVHRHNTPLYSSDGRVLTPAPWRRDAPFAFDFISADTQWSPPPLLDVSGSAALPAVCQYVPGLVGTFTPELAEPGAVNVTLQLPAGRVYQLHAVLVTGGAVRPRPLTVTASLQRTQTAPTPCAAWEPLWAPPPGVGRLVRCAGAVFARFVHLRYEGEPTGEPVTWPPVHVFGVHVAD